MSKQAVQDVLKRICKEQPIQTGWQAKKTIENLIKQNGLDVSSVLELWQDPLRSLGAFNDQPEYLQKGMSEAADYYYSEYYFLNSPVVYSLVYRNPLFFFGEYITYVGWKFKEKWSVFCRIENMGRFVTRAIRFIARYWINSSRYFNLKKAPFLFLLWKYIGLDIDKITFEYIEKISVNTKIGPVYKSKQMNRESCALLGLDFLMSERKIFFIEGNVNPGFNNDRLWIFPKGDPVCLNLVEYAQRNGYSTITFNPTNFYGYLFPEELENSWKEIAAQKNIDIQIVDDHFNSSPYRRPRGQLQETLKGNHLHVNGRYVDGPLGVTIAYKGVLEEMIRSYLEKNPTDDLSIPRKISLNAEVGTYDSDSRFPNIIVKNIYQDQAKGIFLLKANELPKKFSKPFFSIDEYVVPDRVEDAVKGEEYVFVFRSYLLLSHQGPFYLGTRKDISSVPVPAQLDDGLVDNSMAYIANASRNAHSVEPSAEEICACENAVLCVGNILHDYLSVKHESLIGK